MRTRRFLSLLLFFSCLCWGKLHAQNCTAMTNNIYETCRYSTITYYAQNTPPGAIYNWTVGGGLVLLQNNGSSIKVYCPNSGQYSISLQQQCPLNSQISSHVQMLFVTAGTQLTNPNMSLAGPDTVLATVPTNFNFTWNYTPLGNGTNSGFAILYPSPTAKLGNASSITPSANGPHTDTKAVTFTSSYSIGKHGLAVVPFNGCGDTIYEFVHVLGAINGPAANCLGDIVNYNLPVGTVNLWTVTGGNILSGQGTNTVQVQWTTAGTGTIQCNWTHGTWGTNTNSRSINVGTLATPTITGSATLCSNSQTYSIPNIPGHSYRWTVNGVNRGFSSNLNLAADNNATYNLIVFDSIGTCVATAAMIVTNAVYPHPALPSQPASCQHSTIALSVPAVPGATYTWNAGGGNILSGSGTNSITVTYPVAGDYYPTVNVNVGGCQRNAQGYVNAYPAGRPTLGPDFSLCPGATATITNTTMLGGFIVFYTGGPGFNSGLNMTANGPGTYWMQTTVNYGNPTCVSRDTVIVTASPSVGVSLGPDQAICLAPSTILTPTFSGSVGPYSYAWSTGATTSTVTVGPGTYSVTVTAAGYCVDADTIVVTGAAMPAVSLPSNLSLCAGQGTMLDAGPGYASYLWSTGATTQSIIVTTAGSYGVTATDAVGCQTSTMTTLLLVNAPTLILGADTMICPDTFAVFSTGGFATYIWNTGAMTSSIQATAAGAYTVTVSDFNGCAWTDTVVLSHNPDCIWPGDANHDGVADNADILNIGYALIATGPIRPNATNSWYGQLCANWSLSFPSTLNFKHGDCDGSGLVDNNDTLVVIQNYGLTHNKGAGISAGPALTFHPLQPSYTVGDVVDVAIHLGDASLPALATNGVAYSVTVGGITTAPGDVWFSFPLSFLGSPGNNELAVAFEDVSPGRHDVGQSRTGASPVNGFGQIAIMHIRTDSILLPLQQNPLTFNFSGLLLVDDSLQSQPVAASAGSVIVYAPGVTAAGDLLMDRIMVYPSPADDHLQLRQLGEIVELGVTLTDLAGRVCYKDVWRSAELDIPVRRLAAGTYILKLSEEARTMGMKKVSIIHN